MEKKLKKKIIILAVLLLIGGILAGYIYADTLNMSRIETTIHTQDNQNPPTRFDLTLTCVTNGTYWETLETNPTLQPFYDMGLNDELTIEYSIKNHENFQVTVDFLIEQPDAPILTVKILDGTLTEINSLTLEATGNGNSLKAFYVVYTTTGAVDMGTYNANVNLNYESS